MTGGVGVLIACVCAAALLLAWQLGQSRASAKQERDADGLKRGSDEDGIASAAPEVPVSVPAASPAEASGGPDPAQPEHRAAEGIGSTPALQPQMDGGESSTANVEEIDAAGGRHLEAGSELAASSPEDVAGSSALERVRDAGPGEVYEAASTVAEPAGVAAIVAGPVKPPEGSAGESGGREDAPVPAATADHEDRADARRSGDEGVTQACIADTGDYNAGPESGDPIGISLHVEAVEAGDADRGEAAQVDVAPGPEAVQAAAHPAEDPVVPRAEDRVPAGPPPRPSKPAQHRDRRGQRRATPRATAADGPLVTPASADPPRAPAEAKLRLELHPIRCTATLTAILTRPEGFPDTVHVELDGTHELAAYDAARYDDLSLAWSDDLLAGEIRLGSREGFQWLRSARQVHLFQEIPEEVGLVSTGAAKAGQRQAIVCSTGDADAVRAAATACGSPPPTAHDGWIGVPAGWMVLSDYRPAHSPAEPLSPGLSSMDPGLATEIRLAGGLIVRGSQYAQGHPPRIEIEGLPAAAQVTIDGVPAALNGGAWIADGWCSPGQHLVDVVPGPSMTYHVLDDPWLAGRWEPWEAHPGRFGADASRPWQQVAICGARLSAPGGRHVVVATSSSSVVLLGLARGATALRPRDGLAVTMALVAEAPAFLISTSGPRRAQGRVEWLSPELAASKGRGADAGWVAAVRLAAARRLPIESASAAASRAWQRARERARRLRRAKP